jgi:hypothetical protein
MIMIILPELEFSIPVETDRSRVVERVLVKFTPVEINFRAGSALVSSKFMYRYELYTSVLKIESNPEKGIVWLDSDELNLLKNETLDNADIRVFFNNLIDEVLGWKPLKEEETT